MGSNPSAPTILFLAFAASLFSLAQFLNYRITNYLPEQMLLLASILNGMGGNE